MSVSGEQKLIGLLAGYTALASGILAAIYVSGSDNQFLVGLLLGSTFAYAILASSWAVFGLGTRKQRLPVFPTILVLGLFVLATVSELSLFAAVR